DGIGERAIGGEGAVVDVAEERFLVFVRLPGHLDERAGIGGDDEADVRVGEGQPKGDVSPDGGIGDLVDHGGEDILRADEAVLHRLHESADVAAGESAGGGEAVVVAGEL